MKPQKNKKTSPMIWGCPNKNRNKNNSNNTDETIQE